MQQPIKIDLATTRSCYNQQAKAVALLHKEIAKPVAPTSYFRHKSLLPPMVVKGVPYMDCLGPADVPHQGSERVLCSGPPTRCRANPGAWKIFGLMRSGTNFVSEFIELNFGRLLLCSTDAESRDVEGAMSPWYWKHAIYGRGNPFFRSERLNDLREQGGEADAYRCVAMASGGTVSMEKASSTARPRTRVGLPCGQL
jgi:hypothetical protein